MTLLRLIDQRASKAMLARRLSPLCLIVLLHLAPVLCLLSEGETLSIQSEGENWLVRPSFPSGPQPLEEDCQGALFIYSTIYQRMKASACPRLLFLSVPRGFPLRVRHVCVRWALCALTGASVLFIQHYEFNFIFPYRASLILSSPSKLYIPLGTGLAGRRHAACVRKCFYIAPYYPGIPHDPPAATAFHAGSLTLSAYFSRRIIVEHKPCFCFPCLCNRIRECG